MSYFNFSSDFILFPYDQMIYSLPMNKPYKRILLKLSGEALLGKKVFGIDYDVLDEITAEIAEVHAMGIEIAIDDFVHGYGSYEELCARIGMSPNGLKLLFCNYLVRIPKYTNLFT